MDFSEATLATLIDIVRQAASDEIVPLFRNLPGDAIDTKAHASDFVTKADRRAEEVITARVRDAFPLATVIGEEAVADDPGLLEKIADAERSVIIDPIDGTWNFVDGLPLFGVMLAVAEGGRTKLGIVYDPLGDDWVCAIEGLGAWYGNAKGARRRLSVTPVEDFRHAVGFFSIFLFEDEVEKARMAQKLAAFHRVLTLRCSAYEYRMLALGSASFLLTPHIRPWDHAAGELIFREAGGHAALVDGRPYSPAREDGMLLLAPDEATWHALREHFEVG
ncbi:inositol monophosphatase family protein [Rhodobium gokarnense]|uniref:Fructose-1,6-bisphosphatase/inositol monophosphatase family enzyme n=1 Tax=Rhodobium gokarnense TaxID=364296 RepID=A0ABT3HIG8_9HYPH|nr:inositol monophosphatase [Rhodobium gokarnense]MCW2310206.1 fructose-1,6-bisphosphatase/inositol monophosphatase family enzyme [Rhodobium gokarnense]